MISRFIKYIGVLIIFIFSAISIFFALAEREIENENLKKNMAYTSFFEDRFYDLRMRMTITPDAKDDRLVLAAIDDQSLTQIGRWPWSRTVWSGFLKKMETYGASVVSFDVFFSEPELACNVESPDKVFKESIESYQMNGGKVILPYSLTTYRNDSLTEFPDELYDAIIDTKQAQGLNLRPYLVANNVWPIQELRDASPTLGHIQGSSDLDGIYRHYLVAANVDELYLPSYAYQVYQSMTGDKPVLEIPAQGIHKLNLTNGNVNLNYKGEVKIRWFGGVDHFPVVSILDILNASDDDPKMHQIFKGNAVFVGSTAFGAHDLRHTPVDAMLPGIVFHMNMVHMLLEGLFHKPLEDSTLYSWIILITGTLFIVLIMLYKNAIVHLIGLILLVAGLFYLDTFYLLPRGYEIKLFFCLFSPVASYSWLTFLEFYITNKEKNKIKGTFSSYVSPAVVEEMINNPDKVRVGGEKKNITVFFSDVRDFTSISEKLTPEELARCLNIYMGVMTDIIFKHHGTLDKYIGDAIVSFWGAPMPLQNHPYHAVSAALEMIEALPNVNEQNKALGFPELKHGIGLNTGECSVGNMGSDKIFQYTALGDNMNLGARLESLCKFYGVELNVSEYTIEAIPEDLRATLTYRVLDRVRVKGKEKPVTIYEVFHSTHPFKLDKEALADYNRAFELYQTQKFKEASEILKRLTEKHPQDKSCKRILKACEDFISFPPPPDWDGVFTHTSK
jgi:adenylate cyclase